MTAHSVAELRDAWRALEAGEFAPGTRRPGRTPTRSPGSWTPASSERVVAVVGCAGGAGASTLALALATATDAPARVIECCPPHASGFPAAATAELGADGAWRRGSRSGVLLERRTDASPDLPVPAASAATWTFVDAGSTALTDPDDGWLASLLRTEVEVVLVTSATVPGLRRLESCAELLGCDALGVVVGPPVKRWPRPVQVAASALPAGLRLVDFPLDPRLQVTGLTPDPLPASLLKAAQSILTLLRKEPS